MEHLIFRLVAGSHMYGLDTPESDRDKRGVFIHTPESILGMSVEHNVRRENKRLGVDEHYISLQSFIQQCFRGSITWVELLYAAPESAEIECQALRQIRGKFLTVALTKKSLGYMTGMLQRNASRPDPDWKDLCHAVRIGHMIQEGMKFNHLVVRREWDKDALLEIKRGLKKREVVVEEATQLIARIESARCSWPKEADEAELNRFLVEMTVAYWKKNGLLEEDVLPLQPLKRFGLWKELEEE